MLTQERLKEMLSYNTLTGEFIRIKPLKGNTLESAIAARLQAEIKYGFHENHGRIN